MPYFIMRSTARPYQCSRVSRDCSGMFMRAQLTAASLMSPVGSPEPSVLTTPPDILKSPSILRSFSAALLSTAMCPQERSKKSGASVDIRSRSRRFGKRFSAILF